MFFIAFSELKFELYTQKMTEKIQKMITILNTSYRELTSSTRSHTAFMSDSNQPIHI